MDTKTPVERALELDEAEVILHGHRPTGPIGRLAGSLDPDAHNLLGFVLDMSYDEATVVTCDAWKRKCGGVPKNSFVLIRLNPAAARLASNEQPRPAVILARVVQAVATPVSQEVQQTIFTIHKVQAVLDPYTNADLQWGALQVGILGTYYDDAAGEIAFGNDIDSYMSPHFYEVYVPEPAELELLVNSFVAAERSVRVGALRYTETQTKPAMAAVPIRVSPHDFVANRTALFGKTRMGKSNTIKVIADMMLRSQEHVGQVVFDLNGEYSNVNEQDETSLFDLHRERCVRYSLSPEARTNSGAPPQTLKVNFFEQVELGHSIITSLFDVQHANRPNYVLPFLDWQPCDKANLEERFPERGDRQRYLRAQAMYFAALVKAGFEPPAALEVGLILKQAIRVALANDEVVSASARVVTGAAGVREVAERQSVGAAMRVFERLHALYNQNQNRNNTTLFPPSERTGAAYFDEIHVALMRMLGDPGVSGTQYLIPFSAYHDSRGGDILANIVARLAEGKTVMVDLANADEVVAGYYSELICRRIFREQTAKFTAGALGDHSVLIYFEEAHNFFRSDDKDLRSTYNRLAKEGAKYRIGMVYATQSMTTLSPDLLKNTENFFIAHLNDDREIRELTNRYEFRDIALDVQRCKTRGYVRMITLSHRYALPVQIEKFAAPPVPAAVTGREA